MQDSETPEGGSLLTAPVFVGWMTRAELAEELNLAIDTLAKWGSAGTGPVFIRIGSKTYYRRATVRAWLDSLEARETTGAKR